MPATGQSFESRYFYNIYVIYCTNTSEALDIQDDSREKANNLGDDSIGHRKKKIHINMCLIFTGYQESSFNLQNSFR
jgi:hypothetical protein